MGRYKIVYEKKKCIGAFACIAGDRKTWEQDGKRARLIDSIEESDEIFVKEVDDLGNNLEAADMCPARCIHVYDTKLKKKLI